MRILQYNSQLQLRGQSTRYKVSSQFCLLLASTDCQEISPKYCKVETLSSYDHRPQGTEKRGLFTNPQLNRLDCYNSHMMSIQLPVPRVTRPHLSRYSIEPNPPTYTAVVSQKDVRTIVIRCSRFGITYIYWSSASWVQLSRHGWEEYLDKLPIRDFDGTDLNTTSQICGCALQFAQNDLVIDIEGNQIKLAGQEYNRSTSHIIQSPPTTIKM